MPAGRQQADHGADAPQEPVAAEGKGEHGEALRLAEWRLRLDPGDEAMLQQYEYDLTLPGEEGGTVWHPDVAFVRKEMLPIIDAADEQEIAPRLAPDLPRDPFIDRDARYANRATYPDNLKLAARTQSVQRRP